MSGRARCRVAVASPRLAPSPTAASTVILRRLSGCRRWAFAATSATAASARRGLGAGGAASQVGDHVIADIIVAVGQIHPPLCKHSVHFTALCAQLETISGPPEEGLWQHA